jgi:hypothetical protein
LTIILKISREFQSKRIIYSDTKGHVLTPFFEKQVKRDKEKWLMKTESEDHVWFEDQWMVASLCDE